MPELARFRAKHGPLEERAAEAAASILHVAMDAIFVAVELLERPELHGRHAVVDGPYLERAGTERLHGPPLAAADKLLRTIKESTGLPCSGGLATTRLTAKVASDQAKPSGLVWVPPGGEARFLAPLPVRKIPGI